MDLIFASNNPHKVREIGSIIGSEFTISGPDRYNITEDIPENELTLEGNSLSKARYIHRITGMNVFADDTGLETEALNGLPGVHSARFAGESKDSDANVARLLEMMRGIENRNARFRTVIALILDGKEFLFEGIVTGKITGEKRGYKGFGYDPVFIPDGENKTFAEMELSEKNKLSHRARAFNRLKEFLVSRNIT